MLTGALITYCRSQIGELLALGFYSLMFFVSKFEVFKCEALLKCSQVGRVYPLDPSAA